MHDRTPCGLDLPHLREQRHGRRTVARRQRSEPVQRQPGRPCSRVIRGSPTSSANSASMLSSISTSPTLCQGSGQGMLRERRRRGPTADRRDRPLRRRPHPRRIAEHRSTRRLERRDRDDPLRLRRAFGHGHRLRQQPVGLLQSSAPDGELDGQPVRQHQRVGLRVRPAPERIVDLVPAAGRHQDVQAACERHVGEEAVAGLHGVRGPLADLEDLLELGDRDVGLGDPEVVDESPRDLVRIARVGRRVQRRMEHVRTDRHSGLAANCEQCRDRVRLQPAVADPPGQLERDLGVLLGLRDRPQHLDLGVAGDGVRTLRVVGLLAEHGDRPRGGLGGPVVVAEDPVCARQQRQHVGQQPVVAVALGPLEQRLQPLRHQLACAGVDGRLGDQQVERLLLALVRGQVTGAHQHGQCGLGRPAGERGPAGTALGVDGPAVQIRIARAVLDRPQQMVGDQLRVLAALLRRQPRDPVGDLYMQLAPLGPGERAVRDVPGQRVPIAELAHCAHHRLRALGDQPAADARDQVGGDTDGIRPEPPPDHRAAAQRVAGRARRAGRCGRRSRRAPSRGSACRPAGRSSASPPRRARSRRGRSASAGSPRCKRGCPRPGRGSAPARRRALAELQQLRSSAACSARSGVRLTVVEFGRPAPQAGATPAAPAATSRGSSPARRRAGPRAARPGRASRWTPSGCPRSPAAPGRRRRPPPGSASSGRGAGGGRRRSRARCCRRPGRSSTRRPDRGLGVGADAARSFSSGLRGRVAVEDAGLGLGDLGQRPVGDALAVGDAAAAQHAGAGHGRPARPAGGSCRRRRRRAA